MRPLYHAGVGALHGMLCVRQRGLAGYGNPEMATVTTLRAPSLPSDRLLAVLLTHWAPGGHVTTSYMLVCHRLESLILQCHSCKYLTRACETLKKASSRLTELPYLSL